MASYTWIGGGDFYLASNWKDTSGKSPAGPPGPSDGASIGSDGGPATAASITTSGGLTVTGNSLTITGGDLSASGTVSIVNGGSLMVANGDISTTSTLYVTGGTVTVAKGDFSVSSNASALAVTNGGKVSIAGKLTLNNGDLASLLQDKSTLTASGGLVVGAVPTGSFFLTDLYLYSGSVLDVSDADSMIADAGRAEIVLFGGTYDASGGTVVLGNQTGSDGRLDLHGSGASFTASSLTVGKDGRGLLTVVAGTAHVTGQVNVGTRGSISIGSGGTATTIGKLEWDAGFDIGEGGSLTVHDGGSAIGNDLTIGLLGADDKVSASATVDGKGASGPSKLVSKTLTLGGAMPSATNDQGKANGTDGQWSYKGPVGYLTITNGATVQVLQPFLTIHNMVSTDGAETAFGRLKISSGGSLEVGGNMGVAANELHIDPGGGVVGHGLIDSDVTGESHGAKTYSLILKNEGTIDIKDGVLVVHGSLSGNGQVLIERNTTFHLSGSAAVESQIVFHWAKPEDDRKLQGYETTLELDDPWEVASKITGFVQGTVIDLTSVGPKSLTSNNSPVALYSNGVLAISNNVNLSLSGTASGGDPVPTVGMKPDLSKSGTDLETLSLRSLVKLADELYNHNDQNSPDRPTPPEPPANVTIDKGNGHTYTLMRSTWSATSHNLGFEAAAYRDQTAADSNPRDQNIVIVFRGTDNDDGALISFKNWIANGSFLGAVNPMFKRYMEMAVTFVQQVASASGDAMIVLDGHSLGGAIAQLLGLATGFAAAAFNAPGAQQLYDSLSGVLSPVKNLGYGGTNINYRIAGDIVSLVGSPVGQTYRLDSGITGDRPSIVDFAAHTLENHNLNRYTDRDITNNIDTINDVNKYHDTRFADATEFLLSGFAHGVAATPVGTAIHFLGHVLGHVAQLFDPASGASFVLTADAGAPTFASITLPVEDMVASYQARYQVADAWSDYQKFLPGITQLLPDGVRAVEFAPRDAANQPVSLPPGFLFSASFASSGLFSGTLTVAGGAAPAQPAAGSAQLAVAPNSAPAAIHIPVPSDAAYPDADDLAISVTRLPSNGSILLAEGSAPVQVGDLLTVAQLTSLQFAPSPGLAGSSSMLEYAVADASFAMAVGHVLLSIAGTGPGAVVQSLSASTDDGSTTVANGHVVTFTITTSLPVTVSGTPTLQLSGNLMALYASGSGGDTLTFTYAVHPGDNTADLTVTGLAFPAGAAIRDGQGNALTNVIAGDFGLKVDTQAPTIAITSPGGSSAHAQMTIQGTVSGGDVGTEITIYEGETLLGVGSLGLDGSWSVPVTFMTSGSHSVTAQNSDAVGNLAVSSTVLFDTVAEPMLVGAITAGTGAHHAHAGDVVTISVTTTSPAVVAGSPLLQLNDGAIAVYAAGSGTSMLLFSYAVQAADSTSDLQVTGLGLPAGSSIRDLGGDELAGAVMQDLGLAVGDLISIAALDAIQSEGQSGSTLFSFSVTLDNASSVTRTVDWLLAGSGTNQANAQDFSGGSLPSGTLTFAAGETTKTITVLVAGDGAVEPDEGFIVTLVNPSAGLAISIASASGTILNDDSATVSIAAQSAVKAEEDVGTNPFTFTVTLSQAGLTPQTVDWSVAGVGDHPANSGDFIGGVLPSGTVTFAAGETSKTITVLVNGDTTVEFDEFFTVTLANPTAGVTLGTASAIADIQNDDRAQISIAPLAAVKAEGNSGTTAFTFTVNLDQPSVFGTQTADWSVSGTGANPANAGDFGGSLPSGTVSFAPGETSKTITVLVSGDTATEFNEDFAVTLSNPSSGLLIGIASATGTILNDDAPVMSITTASVSGTEGNAGPTPFTFTVSLDRASASSQSVTWAVTGAGGRPADGADFGGILPSGTLTFAPGETSRTVDVLVSGDSTIEFDEGFTIGLSNPSIGVTLGTATASGTIVNDDLSVASIAALAASKAEGNSGTTAFTFMVALSAAGVAAQTVGWSVAGSGAHAADAADFGGFLPVGTVTFAAGETSKVVTVAVSSDTVVEFDEGFTVALSNPSDGLALGTATASGTILNDDGATVSIAALSAVKAEGNSGTTPYTFTVVLSQASVTAQTVGWSVTGSGAHAADAADFGGALPSGTVTFAAGETSKVVTVGVSGDTVVESDEGFTVTLANPSAEITLGTTSTASGTIQNDDSAVALATHGDAYIVQQGQSLSIAGTVGVLANDQSTSSASLLTNAGHGTLQLAANGGFSYTPAAGFSGVDSFSYHAASGGSAADAQALLYVVPVIVGTSTTLNLLALNAGEQIAATYAAFFGRAADAGGFEFWVGQFQANLATQGGAALFANIASSFGVSDEAKALYPFLANPFGASDGQISAFLDSVYNNLFNRGSDAAGLAYWTAQTKATLAAGQFVGSILVNVMSGAQDTADGKDITTLMGKVAVSLDYVHEQELHHTAWNGASDTAAATNLLRTVSADPSTVLTGIKNAEVLVANHA